MARRRGRGGPRRTRPAGGGPIRPAATVIHPPLARAGDIEFTAGSRGDWSRTANRRRLQPDTTYRERGTGYTYRTDSRGRVTGFSGTLQPGAGNRNSYQQRVAGRTDRRTTDQGGHLFAHIFRGPGEGINVVPMDSNLNLSAWKRMENRWARALDGGSTVQVEGTVIYGNGPSERPTHFRVVEVVDGVRRVNRFTNN